MIVHSAVIMHVKGIYKTTLQQYYSYSENDGEKMTSLWRRREESKLIKANTGEEKILRYMIGKEFTERLLRQ